MIEVNVADRERLVAESLARLITAESDMHVRGVFVEGAELMRGLEHRDSDVVLIDPYDWIPLGVDFLAQLQTAHPNLKIIVVTGCIDEGFVLSCLRAHIRGFISKSAGIDEVLHAIRSAESDGATLSNESAGILMDNFSRKAAGDLGLAPRQLDVLRGIVGGMTDREMAHEFHIAEKTVKNYVHRLFSALDARNRTQAGVLAVQTGIVSMDVAMPERKDGLAQK